ncbi:hypothetical protein [Ilumatobacter sp.]|uniref:hypothetical protein n=1 Tax=Ilumatobacter sp. TaxID=1967498 RepID=UPI00375163B6
MFAPPAQQRIDTAHTAIDGGESGISTFYSLHHWSGSETRCDRLAKLDGALSTRREWAAGGPVVDVEAGNAIKIMKADSDPAGGDLLRTSPWL